MKSSVFIEVGLCSFNNDIKRVIGMFKMLIVEKGFIRKETC